MIRVYAKSFPRFYTFFAVLWLAVSLTGCGAGGGYSLPGMEGSTGIVTRDADSIPNVGWQTTAQRQEAARPSLQTATAPAAVQRKVTVAILLPLTGKNAEIGQSMLKAAQMALFDVGSASYSLEPQDTLSTTEGAAAAAHAAVSAKADLILGPIFADDVRAAKAAVGSSGTPMIAFTNDSTVAGGNTYVMGFLPTAQIARVVRYAADKGHDSFAVFAPQTPYADTVIAALQRAGVSPVAVGRYAPGQADLSGAISTFVARNPAGAAAGGYDALVLPLGGESLSSLVSVLSQKGVTSKSVQFIGTGLWDDTALASNPALYGGWFAAPDPALRRDFEKRYQENYGSAAPRITSLAYDATALTAVLARNGGNDPFSRSVLTNPRGYAGVDGVFRFRTDGLTDRGLAVLEVQSGHPRVIDPAPNAFGN